MDKGDEYGCVTRQIIRKRCAPEEVEPGKHVYRCEKTTQTLRDCFGRPTEVIASETEITEHETDGTGNQGIHVSKEQKWSSTDRTRKWEVDIQGFDDVMEGVERMTEGIMGEFKRITEEANRITGGLFGFPVFPDEEREEMIRGDSSFPVKEDEREVDGGEEHGVQEPRYSEFADKIRDV